jgi:hypothetical protein
MNVEAFLQRLGLKEGDFMDLNTLRSKLSGLIEEAAASGDQQLMSFLRELQQNIDTAIISGMKPQMVITTDSSLTLIFSMNTSSETANAVVSKAQNMIKEVSQIKVLDQNILNSLINKYGYLVSEYLNRFKSVSVSKTVYVDKASVVSSSQYQEVIKPIQDYIRETVDVYLRPVIISRQIIQDQRKVVPEAVYEEIVQPQREYVKKTIDIELRPVVVSRTIVMDKTIPKEIVEVEEVSRPIRDYIRKIEDVELKPVVVSKEEYVNQTVSQEQSTYNEIVQSEKQEAKGIVTVEPVYVPVYGVQIKTTYVPEEGSPVSISQGVAPAPASMIPGGVGWREISMPREEKRREEKEKVVL